MLVEVCFELLYCVIEKGISVLMDHTTELVVIKLGLLLSNAHKIQKTLTNLVDTPIYDAMLNFSDALEHIKSNDKSGNKSACYEKYLKRCIFQAGKTLANPSSSVKNMILAIELRLISQVLIGEPVGVVRKMTETRLLELTKSPRIVVMYHELASSGRDFGEQEMVDAYNLYKLCKNLMAPSDGKLVLAGKTPILDAKFFDSLPIRIHNPRVRWRTFGERCARNVAKGFAGLLAFPLSIVAGTLIAVQTAVVIPIAAPVRVAVEAVSTRGDAQEIKSRMAGWYWFHEMPDRLLGPVTGVQMVSQALTDSPDDDGFESGKDFFEKWGILIK